MSLTLSLETLVHLRFAAAVFFLAHGEREIDVPAFFRWLGLGLAVLAVLTAGKFAFPPPESSVPGGVIEWPSAMPGFISIRHLGSWTGAIAAGLMVALLWGRRDRTTALLYLLAAGMTCWSGTRAAVLAMAVVALIVLVSLRRMPDRQGLALVGGLSLLALAGGIVLAPAGLPEFSLFSRETSSANALSSGRLDLWMQTFERWLQAPVFGWGSGSTFWEVYIGWWHTQPHNAVLQFLISWGLVGAAGALWLLGRAIAAVHGPGLRDETLRPLTGTLYALLVMSLLEGMLHYPRFIMLAMIGFAVILAAKKREPAPRA